MVRLLLWRNANFQLADSPFAKHQLDIALLALLLERGHAPLQALDLPLQFGLYALESEQVAALPLVLLGVVVCLSLHLLGLVEPHSRGVH